MWRLDPQRRQVMTSLAPRAFVQKDRARALRLSNTTQEPITLNQHDCFHTSIPHTMSSGAMMSNVGNPQVYNDGDQRWACLLFAALNRVTESILQHLQEK